MKGLCSAVVWPVVLGAVALAPVSPRARFPALPETTWARISSANLRSALKGIDEAEFVLLDPKGIGRDREWRKHFSGQVLGFGIRTVPRSLSQEDVQEVTALLLNPSSWNANVVPCLTAGDAALLMSGPGDQITVMLELSCGRAHIRDETISGYEVGGSVEPIAQDLLKLARKYFPDDAFLERLGK